MLGNLPQVTQLEGGGAWIQILEYMDPKPVQFLNPCDPFIITWKKLGHIYVQCNIIFVKVFNILIISLELIGFTFTDLHVQD